MCYHINNLLDNIHLYTSTHQQPYKIDVHDLYLTNYNIASHPAKTRWICYQIRFDSSSSSGRNPPNRPPVAGKPTIIACGNISEIQLNPTNVEIF